MTEFIHYSIVMTVLGGWVLWAASYRWEHLRTPSAVVTSLGIWISVLALSVTTIEPGFLALLLGQLSLLNVLVNFRGGSKPEPG